MSMPNPCVLAQQRLGQFWGGAGGGPGMHIGLGLGVHRLPSTEIIKKHLAEFSSGTFVTSFLSSRATSPPGICFCLPPEARI